MKKILSIILFLSIAISSIAQNNWVTAVIRDKNGVRMALSDSGYVKVLDVSDNGVSAKIDPITGAGVGIDVTHAEVHECNTWENWFRDGDMDSNDSVLILIQTGPSYYHTTVEVAGTLATSVNISKNSTKTQGTRIINQNRCLGSSYTSTFTVSYNPGGTGQGTPFTGFDFGTSTSSQNRTGGNDRSTFEWILSPTSKYIVRIKSGSDNNVVNLRINHYKE